MAYTAKAEGWVCHMVRQLAWAKGVFVFVQELGAAVSDRPSIVLHYEVVGGLLGVKLEAAVAVQVLPQLSTKGAVCGLRTATLLHTVAMTHTHMKLLLMHQPRNRCTNMQEHQHMRTPLTDNRNWQQRLVTNNSKCQQPSTIQDRITLALDSGHGLATTMQVSACIALLKQAEEDAYLGEHALLIQQGQNAHTLRRACFNQVNTLLIVLKLHQSPVHPLSSIHFLLQLEQMPATCHNILLLYIRTQAAPCLGFYTHAHVVHYLILYTATQAVSCLSMEMLITLSRASP